MTREQRLKFAKVLISLAIVLILAGIGIELESKSLLDPVTDTHVVANSNDSNISITTIDTFEDDQAPNDTTETETENETASESGTNEGSSPAPGNNTKTPSQGNKQQSQQPPQTAQAPSIETTNNNLRNTIQNTYGITVRYGVETNGYSVAGLSSIMLSDPNRINEILSSLNYNLSLYPSGFFNETKQGGYTLTIYLLKKYSQDNVTGITDSTTKNVVISLATDYSFVESLHHEVYHYIEKYMYYKGANYTTWNVLNPSGFTYGSTNASLSYTTGNNPNASFVNNYAQTDEYEDRASTFEYMMSTSEASCLVTGTTIWKKSKYMCEQIDAVFQTVSPAVTEHWERYVYN